MQKSPFFLLSLLLCSAYVTAFSPNLVNLGRHSLRLHFQHQSSLSNSRNNAFVALPLSVRGHDRCLRPLRCQATDMALPQIEEADRLKLWDEIEELEMELEVAVSEENFKEAARLRDTIKGLQNKDPYCVAEQKVSAAASQERCSSPTKKNPTVTLVVSESKRDHVSSLRQSSKSLHSCLGGNLISLILPCNRDAATFAQVDTKRKVHLTQCKDNKKNILSHTHRYEEAAKWRELMNKAGRPPRRSTRKEAQAQLDTVYTADGRSSSLFPTSGCSDTTSNGIRVQVSKSDCLQTCLSAQRSCMPFCHCWRLAAILSNILV
jgi:protein-arginine kinase activator protein McsA